MYISTGYGTGLLSIYSDYLFYIKHSTYRIKNGSMVKKFDINIHPSCIINNELLLCETSVKFDDERTSFDYAIEYIKIILKNKIYLLEI